MPDTIKALFPFTLCCVDCDAGMDVESFRQALLDGWLDIEPDDGFSYNYSGVCPDCRHTSGELNY